MGINVKRKAANTVFYFSREVSVTEKSALNQKCLCKAFYGTLVHPFIPRLIPFRISRRRWLYVKLFIVFCAYQCGAISNASLAQNASLSIKN